jgi:hypothetical protein
MILIVLITIVLFIFLLMFNYRGAVGRIERKNQTTGEYQDLGPVSEKEDIAFMEGRHKKLAFYQALIGALIWSLIAFSIMYFISAK